MHRRRGAWITGCLRPAAMCRRKRPRTCRSDRVFVEDLVLPVFIGAYARERTAPQRVRFGVDAWVMRAGRVAEDMRDVFSYDLIVDAIRMLIEAGHIALVETLAERIAAMVLAHPRVTKVVVRVQKLETGMGTVGIEIERRRAAVRTASSADRAVGSLRPWSQAASREPVADRGEARRKPRCCRRCSARGWPRSRAKPAAWLWCPVAARSPRRYARQTGNGVRR